MDNKSLSSALLQWWNTGANSFSTGILNAVDTMNDLLGPKYLL